MTLIIRTVWQFLKIEVCSTTFEGNNFRTKTDKQERAEIIICYELTHIIVIEFNKS